MFESKFSLVLERVGTYEGPGMGWFMVRKGTICQ